jgi:hypothetical protein
MGREQVSGEDRDEPVRRDFHSLFVDHADAIPVAVESEPEIGPEFLHLRRQILHVLRVPPGSGKWFGKSPSGSQ